MMLHAPHHLEAVYRKHTMQYPYTENTPVVQPMPNTSLQPQSSHLPKISGLADPTLWVQKATHNLFEDWCCHYGSADFPHGSDNWMDAHVHLQDGREPVKAHHSAREKIMTAKDIFLEHAATTETTE